MRKTILLTVTVEKYTHGIREARKRSAHSIGEREMVVRQRKRKKRR